MDDANRKIGSTSGKVMSTATVPPPPSTGRPGELPQLNPGVNPSQAGMNKPSVPSYNGMSGTGGEPPDRGANRRI
jgi:hypothetical protein